MTDASNRIGGCRSLRPARRPPALRELAGLFALATALAGMAGCESDGESAGRLEAVWGRRGLADGRFQKPRAMAIDADDRVYIVDMTARIQVFDPEGNFLRKWQTPVWTAGKPTGLSIGRDGNLLVADTHYYRVLVYSPEGELLQTIGGQQGESPGQFNLVLAAVQDAEGNFYVSEMGEFDRIQKFAPDGTYLAQWGSRGSQPGQFLRAQGLAIDEAQNVWVADSCNHRVQVFDRQGELLRCWGRQGRGAGELYYPYDLVVAGDRVYVCEYGNHRVQVFTLEGESLGFWGREGRGEGQLFNPWAVARNSRGRTYVLDTNNHRVLVVRM
jgi:DNA-binding beta-propeller fold protein YncE